MTNKEALITVSKSCKALAMEFGFRKICDTDKTALNTLKQLVDKATPKKTIKKPIIRDKYRQYKNYCPICKQELLILGDYCLYCGQKVDWSGNDE